MVRDGNSCSYTGSFLPTSTTYLLSFGCVYEREREREREMHLMTSVYCFNNNVISYIFENGLYLICISRCQFIIFVIEGKVLDLLILVAAARTDSLLLLVALKFLN